MNEDMQQIRERLLRVETTLWGANGDNGLRSSLRKLEQGFEDLKAFQLKVLGAAGAVFFFAKHLMAFFQ